MAKKKYRFNPETLTYEVIAAPFRLRFYRILRKLLIGFILASVVNFVFSYFFQTPKMSKIERENSELVMKYDILRDKIDASTRKISEIRQRDANVYRMLFAADTMDIPGVYTPYPESKYEDVRHDRLYGGLMASTWMDIDRLTRLLYLESRSLDQLQTMSIDKEKMSLSVPAIWPIDKRKLKGRIGAFGGRNHPILGRFIPHKGIDLGADRGTPVYATGNGMVIQDPDRGTGYGLQVFIDHGFGYKTRYAHLNEVDVNSVESIAVLKGDEAVAQYGAEGRNGVVVITTKAAAKKANSDDKVDVGYGRVSRRSRSSSVNEVEYSDKAPMAIDLRDYIQGRVVGVQFVDGKPVIRGRKSVNGDSEALVLIDGMPTNSFEEANELVDPRNIESVNVVGPTNIYGSRGANGAILIKTRKK